MILLFREDLCFAGFRSASFHLPCLGDQIGCFAWRGKECGASGLEKEGATTLSPEFSDDQNEGVVSPHLPTPWFTGKGGLT